jgi:CDP-diacylglycerol--glycerol-3-phosphate 3-phosphatidyltransferase
MISTVPNFLTLLRIALIPFIVVLYLTGAPGIWIAGVFLLASATDWLDGFLARRMNQISPFGAFLDPVADKLMIAVVLVMLVSDRQVVNATLSPNIFSVVIAIIIGREIAISALREWMAEIGNRTRVTVNQMGKVKTTVQMIAITLLLYQHDFWVVPVFRVGEVLLYIAAMLTLWSMISYLRAAWPALNGFGKG